MAFTLVNRTSMPHSMDFHAAEIAPSKYYVNVIPGDSIHYRFVARVPGAFMYHCGTAPTAMHIANGMYGALIVDPAISRPRARELVLVQSEFYLTPKADANGARGLDWGKLLALVPDHSRRRIRYLTFWVSLWKTRTGRRGLRGMLARGGGAACKDKCEQRR